MPVALNHLLHHTKENARDVRALPYCLVSSASRQPGTTREVPAKSSQGSDHGEIMHHDTRDMETPTAATQITQSKALLVISARFAQKYAVTSHTAATT